jgi:(1->4)-alpha-D-glucan 1-alpha-D-glucosylmutase
LASREFLADFHRRTAPLRLAGAVTSLSQLAIKLAAPGVPDIYQGTEFWDLSLVDPDNRRMVDFAPRSRALEDIDGSDPDQLLRDWPSGRAKLRLLKAGLSLRRERSDLFVEGDYLPLEVSGSAARNLIAFARRRGEDWLIALATRLSLRLLDGTDIPRVDPRRWGDTVIKLPEEARALAFRDLLSGETLPPGDRIAASAALARYPTALFYAGRG